MKFGVPDGKKKTTTEKTLKFGLSQYDGLLADGEFTSVQVMRSFFLRKVSELRPDVADELEDELDLYQRIPNITTRSHI